MLFSQNLYYDFENHGFLKSEKASYLPISDTCGTSNSIALKYISKNK